MNDSTSLSRFFEVFGVSADDECPRKIADGLSRLPPDDLNRRHLVAAASEELLVQQNAALKVANLLGAHFGSAIFDAGFFDAARQWLLVDRRGGGPLAEAIRGWADRVLQWPRGFKPEDIQTTLRDSLHFDLPVEGTPDWQKLIEEKQREYATIVADRFFRLVGRPFLESDSAARPNLEASSGETKQGQLLVDMELQELFDSMVKWRECGVSSRQATELIFRWALSLKRMGRDCWKGMFHIVEAGLEVFWNEFWIETVKGEVGSATGNMCLSEQLSAAALLPWWLLGNAHRGISIGREDHRIPHVVASFWRICNAERDRLSSLQSAQFDRDYAFAGARYGLEALAQYIWDIWAFDQKNVLPKDELSMMLACALEEYSSRIAVNRWILPQRQASERPVSRASVASSSLTIADESDEGEEQWYEDPKPNEETTGINQLPFIKDRCRDLQPNDEKEGISNQAPTDNRLLVPPRPLSSSKQRIEKMPRCSDQTFKSITPSLSAELWNSLPARTAFLGLYDLPRCDDSILPGRPVAVLAIRHPEKGLVLKALPSERGDLIDGRMIDTSGNFQEAFDRAIDSAFDGYRNETKEKPNDSDDSDAKQKLARDLATALLRRHDDVNRHFGPLLEELIARMEEDGVSEKDLCGYDLIVCPRGMAAGATIDLLGETRCLIERFQSISITPSLPVWKVLQERSGSAPLRAPLRLGVVGWERPEKPEDHPGQGLMVRELMRMANYLSQAGETGPLANVFMAAESPIASLQRTWQMAEVSDFLVVFGHGSKKNTGLVLADGVFPAVMPTIQGEPDPRPQVVLTCACFGGRFAQPPDRADALNPLVDATSITLLLSDQMPRRLPSLAGGFINKVPGIWASEVLVSLLRRRLESITANQSDDSGFGLARCRSACLKDYFKNFQNEQFEVRNLIRYAKSKPVEFLRLFAALSLHLVGVEPKILNAIPD